MIRKIIQTPKIPMQKAKRLVELQQKEYEIKKEILKLKEELLIITRSLDVLSLKTGTYTISRVVKKLIRVTDFEQLKSSLEKADIPYLTKEVFADQMDLVFKQLIDTKPTRLPKGLSFLKSEYIMIRLADK